MNEHTKSYSTPALKLWYITQPYLERKLKTYLKEKWFLHRLCQPMINPQAKGLLVLSANHRKQFSKWGLVLL